MTKNKDTDFLLSQEDIPANLVIDTKTPRRQPIGDESIEFHAARVMLLLKYAGGRESKLVGRVKIAKLDFFVRYPSYLTKAAGLLGIDSTIGSELPIESPMIRYKYGPWDSKFYDVFALLVAKDLMSILPSTEGDIFSLTLRGQAAVEELMVPEFEDIIARIRLVNRLFGGKSGTAIKNFIYKNFPRIVAQPMGMEIQE